MDVGIMIAEEAYLEIFDQSMHLLLVEEQGWNSYKGEAVVRDRVREIEFGQNRGREQPADDIVHKLHGSLRAGQQKDQERNQQKTWRKRGRCEQQRSRQKDGKSE